MDSTQAAVEPDLIYPLLRGRDVKRWTAEPSSHIIMAQDPVRRRGIQEDEMKVRYPKTYLYLKRFEDVLRQRSAFKRYFTRKDKSGRTVETGTFYSMFNVGDYTFAPYKVVWPWISVGIAAAVVSDYGEKPVCPEHNTSFVGCNTIEEAYFICALLNSTICDYSVRAFYGGGGGGIASPRVLESIRIPRLNSQNKLHCHLAELFEKAHESAKIGDKENVKKVEKEIDEISAQIWGLEKAELKEIKTCLGELN